MIDPVAAGREANVLGKLYTIIEVQPRKIILRSKKSGVMDPPPPEPAFHLYEAAVLYVREGAFLLACVVINIKEMNLTFAEVEFVPTGIVPEGAMGERARLGPEDSSFPCDECGRVDTETVLHSVSGTRLCTDRESCQSFRGLIPCPNCAQLERENEQLAHALAHVSGAITGNLKPHVLYPGKPFAPIEEGLCIYRACQLLAERVIKMREGREATEVELQAELIWFVKCAEKELPVPIPQRKEPS